MSLFIPQDEEVCDRHSAAEKLSQRLKQERAVVKEMSLIGYNGGAVSFLLRRRR